MKYFFKESPYSLPVRDFKLHNKMVINFINVKLWYLIPAISSLSFLSFYSLFFNYKKNFTNEYIYVQKDIFFYLNRKLSEYASLQFNLTQLGDILISFSLLSIFIVYAPKLWEALVTSALLSLIVSASLKKIFSVPRPAAIFDNDSFIIIGKTLSGNTSLPSGHSIATFVVVTILLFAFMPKKKKTLWFIFMLIVGLTVALSRIGVGAHYPLDVVIGSIIGYIVAILGIKINNKINWLCWIRNRKYYPIFILLLIICVGIIITKIVHTNLLILYVTLSALFVTIYSIIINYVKKY